MKALGKGSIASWVQVALLIAWWFLGVAFIGLCLAALVYLAFLAMTGLGVIDPATIPAIEPGQSSVQIQMSGVDAEPLSGLAWTDWQIIIPGLMAAAVTIGGSLLIVSRLRRLFESFTSAEPFRRENAQHLRVIWITMVVMELARYALLVLMGVLLGVFGKPDFVGTVSFSIDSENLSSWLSIFILIVLAEVFREGARLKEEQELTI